MSHEFISRSGNIKRPAPCIVDAGLLVDKRDMQRLLGDLSRVKYVFFQDGEMISHGEGCVVEVFHEGTSATMVANGSIYLNVASFDCLQLGRSVPSGSEPGQCFFDLMQDDRCLRLIPMGSLLRDVGNDLWGIGNNRNLDRAALDAVVADVLSSGWDGCVDEDEDF
jgi:hypothetical protein